MNLEQLHRDIGRLEGEMRALRRDVDGINDKLDAVLSRQYKFAGALSLATGLVAYGVAWFAK